MSYQRLIPLIKKTGSTLSPEEFQSRINVVFHDYEAAHYDRLHDDMWESLQEQINLLVDDWFAHQNPNSGLKLLDIGCGTGLSTQKLLATKAGQFIDEITLLDTSAKMLEQAAQKAVQWNKKHQIVNGLCDVLTDGYDVIIVCSVLHHIPDLDAFFQQINRLLNPNGILIHLQDPNGDYAQDEVFIQREDMLQKQRKSTPKRWVDYLPNSFKNNLNRWLGRKNYIDYINDQLLGEKVITKRMTADEIWSVTDIHVESKDDTQTRGISFEFLKNSLQNFRLISHRSYAFYGVLKSDLPVEMQQDESQWIQQNQLNGRNLACVWQKKD